MNLIEKLLIKHEGLKLKPYRDIFGNLSIGVGRNLDDVGISELEALELLRNDISDCQLALHKTFTWFNGLGEPRQAVVVSMVFNMGLSKFQDFHKMISALAKADYESAANEMLCSKWAGEVGARASELASIMASGSV